MGLPIQTKFPPYMTNGTRYELRVNRVAEATEDTDRLYTLADQTESLTLDTSTQWLASMGGLQKGKSVSLSIADEVDLQLNDQWSYSGKLGDGTPVSEDLFASKTTMLETLFNDYEEGTYYRFFISKIFEEQNDLVTNGTTTVTSASGKFTSDHVGLSIEGSWGVRKIAAFTDANTVTVNASITAGTGQHFKVCELAFIGTIDPNTIDESHSVILSEQTDNEVRLPSWNLRVNSLKDILDKKTVGDVRDLITDEDFYLPDSTQFYGGLGVLRTVSADNILKTLETRVPVLSSAESQEVYTNYAAIDGGHGISTSKVFKKIFEAAGFERGTTDKTFRSYGQTYDGNLGYNVDTTEPGSVTEDGESVDVQMGTNLMHYELRFGVTIVSRQRVAEWGLDNKLHTTIEHLPAVGDRVFFHDNTRHDGDYFAIYWVVTSDDSNPSDPVFEVSETEGGTPLADITTLPEAIPGTSNSSYFDFAFTNYGCTWEADTTLAELLKLLCAQWGVYVDVEYNQLTKEPIANLRSIRKAGTLDVTTYLQDKLMPGAKSKPGKVYGHVKIKNSNTEGYAVCPHEKGEALEIEIPFKVQQRGESGSPGAVRVKHTIFDKKRGFQAQQDLWQTRNVVDTEDNNFDDLPNSALYVPGLYLYAHYDSAGDVYSTNWYSKDPNVDTNWSANYARSFWVWRGEGTGFVPATGRGVDIDYANTLYQSAILYANEFLPRQKVIRKYATACGPNGRIGELKPGIICQFYYKGEVKHWKAARVVINLVAGTTEIEWHEFNPEADDSTITPLPVKYKDEDSQRTGGSGTVGGSGSGGGSSDNAMYLKNSPETTDRNKAIAPYAGVVPLSNVGYQDDNAHLHNWQQNIGGTVSTVAFMSYNGVLNAQGGKFIPNGYTYGISVEPIITPSHSIMCYDDAISGSPIFWVGGTNGNVFFKGSLKGTRYVTGSGTTTLDTSHFIVDVSTTSGNATIALPSAVTNSGTVYVITRTTGGANSLTIDPNGSETINGAATLSLPNQWDTVTLYASGGNGWVYSAIGSGGSLTGAIIIDPASDTRNVIQPTGDYTALNILGPSGGGVENIFEVSTPLGAEKVYVDSAFSQHNVELAYFEGGIRVEYPAGSGVYIINNPAVATPFAVRDDTDTFSYLEVDPTSGQTQIKTARIEDTLHLEQKTATIVPGPAPTLTVDGVVCSVGGAAANFNIAGISSDGLTRVVTLHNDTAFTMTLLHASGLALANDRFQLTGGANLVINSDECITLHWISGLLTPGWRAHAR